MSKPRYDWWSYVKGMIRRYPGLAEEYAALHEQGTTAAYTGMPGGGGAGRPLEAVATRTLPPVRQREYDAVRRAIEDTRRLPTGQVRLAVVKYVFWDGRQGRRLLSGAAEATRYSYDAVQDFHRDFILLVAHYYGLLDERT